VNNQQSTIKNGQVEISIVSPHQFFQEHQVEFLPDWDLAVVSVILLLQRSPIALTEFTTEVAQTKDCLRANFIRFGCQLIFALQDLGYRSDLFDPRHGCPLLSRQGNLTFDDNAAVEALLHYPVSNYQNCSLIEHPTWGNKVYPGTVVTQANHQIVESVVPRTQLSLNQLRST